MTWAWDVLLPEVALEIATLLALAEPRGPAALKLAEVGLAVLVQQFQCFVCAGSWHFVDPLIGKVLHSARQDHPLPTQWLFGIIRARTWYFRPIGVEHRNCPNQLHNKSCYLPSQSNRYGILPPNLKLTGEFVGIGRRRRGPHLPQIHLLPVSEASRSIRQHTGQVVELVLTSEIEMRVLGLLFLEARVSGH